MTRNNITPNEEIAELQRDEVEALQAIFETALELVSSRQKSSDEEFEYDFPIVYNIHLNKIDETNDCGNDNDGISTNWPKHPLTVQVSYPPNYPSEEEESNDGDDSSDHSPLPSFSLLHDNTVLEFPSSASNQLLKVLKDTARDEKGMPCVMSCVYAARDFLDGDRMWKDSSGATNSDKNNNTKQSKQAAATTTKQKDSVCYYACLSTHHLLDHKPDNLLKTGHKSDLVGFYKFGTPGIALMWGDVEGIDGFVDRLKKAMPQKKFELLWKKEWNKDDKSVTNEWKCAKSASDLLQELTAIGVPTEDYYTALGLENRSGKDSSNSSSKKGKKNK